MINVVPCASAMSPARGLPAVLYSDGVTEAVNSDGKEFGDERLMAIVSDRRGESAEMIAEAVLAAVTLHARGMPQADDITLVVAKRCQ